MAVRSGGALYTDACIIMIIIGLVALWAGVLERDLALGMRQIRGMSSSWQDANKATVGTLQDVILIGSSPASREGVFRCI